MTAKYELTKLYNRNVGIRVIEESLERLLAGERNTLEHIVHYKGNNVIVNTKPRKTGYKNYVPIRYYVGIKS